jgi:hypothetical protein
LAAFIFADLNQALGETGKVGAALLTRGELADPYVLPTGPTAHVSPVTAALNAAAFSLGGIGTTASRALLGALTALFYALSCLAALLLLAQWQVALWLRLAGAAIVAIVPFRLIEAVIWTRQWDQPLAALILVSAWLLIARAEAGAGLRVSGMAFGLLSGVGALVSPSLLPSFILAFAWIGLIGRRRGELRPAAAGVLVGLAVVALFLVPWGLRNQAVLGHFIMTRSNFGLELAMGNAPIEPSASSRWLDRTLVQRAFDASRSLHPYDSPDAAREVARVGEVAFMQARRDEAIQWILADPFEFVRRSVIRGSLWLVAPERSGYFPLTGTFLPWLWSALMGLLLAAAIAVNLVLRRHAIGTIIFVLLPMAPYLLTHMNERYTLVVYFTSWCAIVVAGDTLWNRRAVRPPRQATPGQA